MFGLPQLHQFALNSGFTGPSADLMSAIAMAESGGDPNAYNPNDPNGGSFGLTQINGVHPGATAARGNPQAAFDLAYKVSNGGTNFKPWSTFTSGAYKQYLDPKMLPAFGNTRALAQLTPQSNDTSGIDPATAATGGLYNTPTPAAVSPGGMDMTAMLPQLVKQAQAMGLYKNPSQMLANMAAGFLGGRGPAQSLAGGFAGLAKAQGADQTEGMGLMKMAMMYGPYMQQQIEQKRLANAAAMTRTGAVGMGTALRLNGLDPQQYGGADEKTLNDQTFADKPLPASTQKQVDTATSAISDIRSSRATLAGLQQQVQNGTFVPDAYHMKIWYPTQAYLGNPLGDPGVVAYQQWKAASNSIAQDILNSAKGVQTDSDRKAAMDILSGGGITSPDQFNAHLNFLQNKGALAEKTHRFQVDQIYKNAKKGAYPWDQFEQNLPAEPPVASAKDIGGNMYGANNVGQPQAASVGNGNASGALPPGAIRLPDGRIAIPAQ